MEHMTRDGVILLTKDRSNKFNLRISSAYQTRVMQAVNHVKSSPDSQL